MATLATLLRQAGIPVRKISKAEELRLRVQYPYERTVTVRIPSRHKHLRDRIVSVTAVYSMHRVRDKNGEPWSVRPDESGLANYVVVS